MALSQLNESNERAMIEMSEQYKAKLVLISTSILKAIVFTKLDRFKIILHTYKTA